MVRKFKIKHDNEFRWIYLEFKFEKNIDSQTDWLDVFHEKEYIGTIKLNRKLDKYVFHPIVLSIGWDIEYFDILDAIKIHMQHLNKHKEIENE